MVVIILCLLLAIPSAGNLLIVAAAPLGEPFDWERAISLYKQGRYDEAIREFEQVLTDQPDHADSLKYIGLAWLKLQEPARAIAPLQATLDLKRRDGRNDIELYLALGQSLLSLNRYDEALPHLETLVRLQPGVSATHYLLGVAYANLNRPEDSEGAMRRTLQLNPRNLDAIIYLATRQIQSGGYREALLLVRRGLATAPQSPDLLRLFAEANLGVGIAERDERMAASSLNDAISAAQRLAGIREDVTSTELLGRALLAARRYQPAERALTRAFEMSTNPTAALCFNLGFALARARSWNRAIEKLEQADRLAPDNLNTLYYLGYVNENLRRYQPALEAYTRAWESGGRSDPELKTSIDRVAAILRQP